jgi:hypothetical protein
MDTVAPGTRLPTVSTTLPVTVRVAGGFTVRVAREVRLPEVAVSVAVVDEATVAGGV